MNYELVASIVLRSTACHDKVDEQMYEPRRADWRSIVVFGALAFYAGTATACYSMPRNLARPHSAVVDEATQILWAEVMGARLDKSTSNAQKPVRYTLRVLQVLKGPAGATIEVNGEGDLSGLWDTTFSDHGQDEFWSKSSGRMGVNGDCSMVSPHFMIGGRYLIPPCVRIDVASLDSL